MITQNRETRFLGVLDATRYPTPRANRPSLPRTLGAPRLPFPFPPQPRPLPPASTASAHRVFFKSRPTPRGKEAHSQRCIAASRPAPTESVGVNDRAIES